MSDKMRDQLTPAEAAGLVKALQDIEVGRVRSLSEIRQEKAEPAAVPPHTCMGGDPGSGLNGPCSACEQEQAEYAAWDKPAAPPAAESLRPLQEADWMVLALTAEVAALRAELAQVKQERDNVAAWNAWVKLPPDEKLNQELQNVMQLCIERDAALARAERAERLIQQVEWAAGISWDSHGYECDDSGACPWCHAIGSRNNGHSPDCPAFGQQPRTDAGAQQP